MKEIKYPVIVEGKYDKIKLSSIFKGVFITTEGFSIFSNEKKLHFICQLAKDDKVIVFTDSDGAGHLIRSYLKTALPDDKIINLYTPQIKGKEKRKRISSKQGFLGVEGMEKEVLLKTFEPFLADSESIKINDLTKKDLYEMGLSGRANSSSLRKIVFRELDLPEDMTTNAFLEVASILYSKEQIKEIVNKKATESK